MVAGYIFVYKSFESRREGYTESLCFDGKVSLISSWINEVEIDAPRISAFVNVFVIIVYAIFPVHREGGRANPLISTYALVKSVG